MGDLKIYDLGDYRCKYDLSVFIESGTLRGEGVEYAMKFGFDEIHSIEILDDMAIAAQNKFKNDSYVTIHNGSSVSILKKLLPTIDKNILFWLDAHFPGADLGRVPYNADNEKDINTPLEAELNLISQRIGKFNDVLIIDDLWLYEDGPYDWGSFKDHVGKSREELGVKDASFVKKLFDKTHNIKKTYKHQGYFIITPK